MEAPKERLIWSNGKIVPWDDCAAHVASPALLAGQVVFEEARLYREDGSGASYAFRLEEHVGRLIRSAETMLMAVPFTQKKLASAVLETARANGLDSCVVRMIAYRGSGDCANACEPLERPSADVAIVCEECSKALQACQGAAEGQGMKACVSSWRMPLADSVASFARIPATESIRALAAQEALAWGCDVSVLLNDAGYVCGSTKGAVFTVRDGVLSTPPASSGAYDALMRDAVLNFAMDLDIPVLEERMARGELYIAEEAFLADDIAGILPLASVDGRQVGKGKRGRITEAIAKRLGRAVAGKLPEYRSWLTEFSCE